MVRTKAGKVAIDLVPHIFEAHAGGTVLKTALVQPGSKLVRHDLIPSRERLGEKLHGEFFQGLEGKLDVNTLMKKASDVIGGSQYFKRRGKKGSQNCQLAGVRLLMQVTDFVLTDFVLTGFVLTDFVLRWLRRMLQCTEKHYRW